MRTEPMLRQYRPVTVQNKNLLAFTFPAERPEVKEMFVTAEYIGRDPRNKDLIEESIVKLFKESFSIDIKTCTEREWAEKITIKGGALKQWQSLIKETKEKESLNSRKAVIIFIACSAVLLIGISLLPKSIPVPIPISASASLATKATVP
ncbi:MAG: hypothetical protein P4L49_06115 [Desulfosporosinus sp.]|nr:hypothetical protein [Desulfosporosinus sp.]